MKDVYHKGTLKDAVMLAMDAHDGQVDKNGEPYVLHLLRVMLAVAPEDRIVAMLHDVVEDTFVKIEWVSVQFGKEIADAVDALTRQPGEPYGAFIERCAENETARRVKIADIKDNLRPGNEAKAEQYRVALAYLEGL